MLFILLSSKTDNINWNLLKTYVVFPGARANKQVEQ